MRILPVTTVGKKILMGITGLIWIIFLITHVAGNLLVFQGRAAINRYGSLLHASAEVLWTVRVIIYGALILHIAAGFALYRASRRARRVGYEKLVPQAATLASRSIRWTGVAVLAFIVFHILHLTTGTIQPVPFHRGDVYGNVTGGLRIGWVAAIYIVATLGTALHVLHGTYASFKSLGWVRLEANPFERRLAVFVALGVWLGFTAIPVAALARSIGAP